MHYKILTTESYFKKITKFLKKHPDMFDRYIKTMKTLEGNPYHPSLRLHKLTGNMGEYYSISLNLQYRVIIDFIIKEDEIIPIDIGTHDKVY